MTEPAAPDAAASPEAGPRQVRFNLPRRPLRVTYILLGLLGLVFLGQLALAPLPGDVDPILIWGAKVNALIARGQWWRLITPLFIHGSVLHFFFNAYALFSLGRDLEPVYGPARFLAVFFLAGLTGSTASLIFSPEASVGASGAIFGLIGAQAVLLYRNRALLGGRARAGLQNILVIAGLNLFIGLQAGARIDNWAHLGGLLGGLALAWVLGPVWRPVHVQPAQTPDDLPVVELGDPRSPRRAWAAAAGLALAWLAATALILGLSGWAR